jgi:hypothetical protein
VIGNNIVVTVIAANGGVAKIGVEAPQQVGILRGELIGDRADRAGRLLRKLQEQGLAGVGSPSVDADTPPQELLVARTDGHPRPTRRTTARSLLRRLRKIPR